MPACKRWRPHQAPVGAPPSTGRHRESDISGNAHPLWIGQHKFLGSGAYLSNGQTVCETGWRHEFHFSIHVFPPPVGLAGCQELFPRQCRLRCHASSFEATAIQFRNPGGTS